MNSNASQLNSHPKWCLLISPFHSYSHPASALRLHPLLRSMISPDIIHRMEAEKADFLTFSEIQCLALLFVFLVVLNTTFDANVGPSLPCVLRLPFLVLVAEYVHL